MLSERVARLNAEQQALIASSVTGLFDADPPDFQQPVTFDLIAAETKLIPHRLALGPIDVEMCLQAAAPERLPELWALAEEWSPGAYGDASALLQYWADGRRTVAETAECVTLESGKLCDPALALRFFRLLEATGYLALEQVVDE